MTNVIGVGSLNQAKNNLANFSSRGVTTWNLLKEVGIIKPDIITLGEKIGGLDITGDCTVSSGTSVSSGIISGSLSVILSKLSKKPNPALIKRSLLTSSTKLPNIPISDQGSGVFSIDNTFSALLDGSSYMPYIHPQKLDLTSADFVPFSSKSFYSTMIPIAFNFTVIHPNSANFAIKDIHWKSGNTVMKECMAIEYEVSQGVIPYYSLIRMKIAVQTNAECQYASTDVEEIETVITFKDSNVSTNYSVLLRLVPTPQRAERILIDSFHNLKFPEDGYVLRDSIFIDKQPYEWKGDHVFTNYMQLYRYLTSLGYHVEVLNEPIT